MIAIKALTVSPLRTTSFWVASFAVWNVIALLNAVQWFTYDLFSGQTQPISQYLMLAAAVWYGRAALSPIALWVGSKYRLRGRNQLRSLVLYVFLSLLLGLLAGVVQVFAFQIASSGRPLQDKAVKIIVDRYLHEDSLRARLLTGVVKSWNYLLHNMLSYCLLLGLMQAWFYYEDSRLKELQEMQLQAELAQSRLTALRRQLHPHFLFNTLHSIATLLRCDVDAAEEMLLRMSELLRVFLDQEATPEVSLARELEFLQCYMGIEQMRFRDRLQSQVDIPDELLDCAVPTLVLQPLVENAIRHGIAIHNGPDLIRVTAFCESNRLHLQVINVHGVLLQADPSLRSGIGLTNTLSQLLALYEGGAEFTLKALVPHGVIAHVTIPLRRISQSALMLEATI